MKFFSLYVVTLQTQPTRPYTILPIAEEEEEEEEEEEKKWYMETEKYYSLYECVSTAIQDDLKNRETKWYLFESMKKRSYCSINRGECLLAPCPLLAIDWLPNLFRKSLNYYESSYSWPLVVSHWVHLGWEDSLRRGMRRLLTTLD